MQVSAFPQTYSAPARPASPNTTKAVMSAFGSDLVSLRQNQGSPAQNPYSAGRIMVRAAQGAIGGAITMSLSGGGVMRTAMVGAGVSGVLGLAVGAATGAIVGAAAGEPIPGAVVGGAVGGGVGAVRGAIHGAILGALGGVFGGGAMGGAISGAVLAAAFPG